MIINLPQSRLDEAEPILAASGLPVSDLFTCNWFALLGWEENSRLVGMAGLEQCGDVLLLRSVAVAADKRGRGIAASLVDELHSRARAAGHVRSYLLTTDAGKYFEDRFGYSGLGRVDAPDGILHSTQFTRLCPDSAQLLEVSLQS